MDLAVGSIGLEETMIDTRSLRSRHHPVEPKSRPSVLGRHPARTHGRVRADGA
jgi:hypothetical protein